MPIISIDIKVATPAGDVPPPEGSRVEFWPIRLAKPGYLRTDAKFTATLILGVGSVTLDATQVGTAYKVVERLPGGNTFYVAITGNALYKDLVHVDPLTLEPEAVALPGWADEVTGLQTSVTAAATAAASAAVVAASTAADVAGIAIQVGEVAGDAAPTIQAAIESAAISGGTVRLTQGYSYSVDGTVQMRSNVTLDLNRAKITAAANADFTDINLGTDEILAAPYNPVSIKPVISVIGALGARLVNAAVINGTIDGNGANQPDLGSYANIAVHEADFTTVNVTSLNARPGITINELIGGANTGRRAFCLFVGHAYRTSVRGTYRNAGYDTIGLREGAVETSLIDVSASKASKGAIQVATGARRTKITGGVYDNTEGGTDTSHAIFCHSAKWLTVTGATMLANTGSCFAAFGGDGWGSTENVVLTNCSMVQSGPIRMVSLPSSYVDNLTIQGLTFSYPNTAGALLYCNNTVTNVKLDSWFGVSNSTSTAFTLINMSDFELSRMNIETAATANQMINMSGCTRGKIGGYFKQVSGVSIFASTSTNIVIKDARIIASDSVQVLGVNAGIDVIDCDLAVTNANKLRIYGPVTGLVRGNKGALTESNGLATITAAATTVTISHGLWAGTATASTPRTDRLWLPRDFQVSFSGNPGSSSKVWVSSVTPTQVTFNVDVAPGSSISLAWAARMDRTA